MDIMRERNGLRGLISDAGVFRSKVVPHPHRHRRHEEEHAEDDFEREDVTPARKDIRHALEYLGASGRVKISDLHAAGKKS
jgi:hypothetical protein